MESFMTPENHQAAMNAPIQQANSDGSSQDDYEPCYVTARRIFLTGLLATCLVAVCVVASYILTMVLP